MEPLELRVAVTISGDEATIDLAGSSPQRQCGMNVYYNYTYAREIKAGGYLSKPFTIDELLAVVNCGGCGDPSQ